ncbi:hypothetical protein BDW22DRAFT_503979 [Trametopsis cervina]|nr:hypothetical protein BDW22DRAFT_503979 [Trametopsis cervina]
MHKYLPQNLRNIQNTKMSLHRTCDQHDPVAVLRAFFLHVHTPSDLRSPKNTMIQVIQPYACSASCSIFRWLYRLGRVGRYATGLFSRCKLDAWHETARQSRGIRLRRSLGLSVEDRNSRLTATMHAYFYFVSHKQTDKLTSMTPMCLLVLFCLPRMRMVY